jgi:hypothetical protein
LFIKAKILEEQTLARVLELQERDGGTLGRIAAALGIATEDAVGRGIALSLGLPFDLLDPGPEAIAPAVSLPPEFCWRRLVVPLGHAG